MLTRLQAINQILTGPIGETPATVLVEGAADTSAASVILDSVTIQVLARGWDFNTEEGVTLQPESDGRVRVPADVLRIDGSAEEADKWNLVKRGAYLFDRKTNSFTLGAAVKVDLLRSLAFEDVPYHVQEVIVAKAAQKYQSNYGGSQVQDAFASRDVKEAVQNGEAAAADTEDYNVLDNVFVWGPFVRNTYRR